MSDITQPLHPKVLDRYLKCERASQVLEEEAGVSDGVYCDLGTGRYLFFFDWTRISENSEAVFEFFFSSIPPAVTVGHC